MIHIDDHRFTNHKQSMSLIVFLSNSEEKVIKFAEVDNWDKYDPALDFQGDELSLYDYHDFDEEVEIEYDVEEITHNALYLTKETTVIANGLAIGKFLYVRECDLIQ